MPTDAAMRAAKGILDWLGQFNLYLNSYSCEKAFIEIIDREFSRGPVIVTSNDPAKAAAARLLERAINHVLQNPDDPAH